MSVTEDPKEMWTEVGSIVYSNPLCIPLSATPIKTEEGQVILFQAMPSSHVKIEEKLLAQDVVLNLAVVMQDARCNTHLAD